MSTTARSYHSDDSRILIVDHIDQRRAFLEKLLTDNHYVVIQAATCEEALELLTSEPADLVLTETELPTKSGLFLLKTVKEKYPDMEVILITHNASSYNLLQALRLGAYDFIVRPIDTGEILYNSVDRALGNIHLRRQNARLIDELASNNRSLRSALKMIKALNTSIERIATKQDIEELLMELLSSAMSEIRAQKGFLALFDKSGESLGLKAGEGIDSSVCRQYAARIPKGLTSEIARRGKPLLIPGNFPDKMAALADGEEFDGLFATPGLLAAPLKLKERVVGVVVLSGYSNRPSFGEHDLHFLIQLSHHAAIAMEKAGIIRQLKRGKSP